MRRFDPTSATFGLVGVVALATLRCNAVLGIDEAQVDPTFVAGASGTGGTGSTTNYSGTHLPIGCIQPTVGCQSCLGAATAGFDPEVCFANSTCRKALDDYRVCLGEDCSRGEFCREELFGSSDPDVSKLGERVNACRAECGEKPLYTQCELYCACMDHNCAGSLATTGAACVQACMTGAASEPGIAYCRKTHCEFAGLEGVDRVGHCEHAIGLGACTAKPAPDPTCNRVQSGFPCSSRADCCTDCSNEVCL